LKHSFNTISDIYVKLFNVILDSGFIPEQLLLENIIPVYKNIGSKVDPDISKPITIFAVLPNYLYRF
jgi:hypothetical protein